MNVTYQDNPEAGQGNGYLIFSGAAFSDGPWEAAVQVPSSQEYLTGKKGKWIGDETFIPLEGEALSDGSIRLRVGSNIVDSLGRREKYRVKLKSVDGGEPLSGRLTIENITYSPVDRLDNTAKASDIDGEEEKRRARAAEEEKLAKLQEQERLAKEAEALRAEREAREKENRAAETLSSESARGPGDAPPSEKSGKKTMALIAALIVALIAAGIGGYFLYRNFAEEGDAPVAETPKSSPAAEPAESPKAEPSVAIKDRVNGFFAETGFTPKKAMDLARSLSPETPADQDALYRLYNYAGEKDEPSALIVYGECFDPSKPQWGTIGKDGFVAWGIYEKAKKANVAGADEAISKLIKWLEDAAEKGDRAAADQLRQIRQ